MNSDPNAISVDVQPKDKNFEVEQKRAVDELKMQRASTKGCITRIKTFITSKADTLTATELECRLEILESYWKLVLSYQTSIEKLTPSDPVNIVSRSELEDLYCEVKSKILSLLPGQRRGSILDGHFSFSAPSTSKANLPPLKLPQFSGRYSDYPNFIAIFNKLVHDDPDKSVTEKYTHLRNCLSGAALRTIDALGKSAATYPEALDKLKERYDNSSLIFQEHVSEMFELPKTQKGSALQLRSLVDNISAHLSALRALGEDTDILNALIIHLVNSKLDVESQAKWDEAIDYDKFPTWEDCEKVLIRRCQFLEAREQKSQPSNPDSSAVSRKFTNRKSNVTFFNRKTTSLAATKLKCNFCSESNHSIMDCAKFVQLTVVERFEQAKRLSLCINCLSKGHSVTRCVFSKCRVCFRPHHTLLHRYPNPNNNSPLSQERSSTFSNINAMGSATGSPQQQRIRSSEPNLSGDAFNSSLCSSMHKPKSTIVKNEYVLLATAIVRIRDKTGCYHFARALLDSASQLNFITKDLAHKLHLKLQRINAGISGIGDVTAKVQHETCSTIKSRMNNFETDLHMWVLPSITGIQPEAEIRPDCWKIPPNIQLADPSFYKPQKVDLLIGADKFFELLSVGQIKLGSDLPTLQKTVFGWVMCGKYKAPPIERHICNVVSTSVSDTSDFDNSLSSIVEKFWRIEDIDLQTPRLNEEQLRCETLFMENIRRLDCGRLMVKLPFKKSPTALGNSFDIAKRRFLALERKLIRSPSLKNQYNEFLQEYLVQDHMELVNDKNIPRLNYYMPHHCVLRPESTTTKLRVVFDGSCPTSSGLSLNDILMVGPTIQTDLQSILLRFRCYKIALIADVSKMYRQFLIYPEDRDFQYILWRNNAHDELTSYRLKTVTYGTASAPYLATRCLKYLADLHAHQFPLAEKIIKEDFYVDDLLTGADTLKQVLDIQHQVQTVLQSGKLQLQKWYSNSTHFLQSIPEEDREKPLILNNCDIIKTLGLSWEPNADEFRFTYNFLDKCSRITKRTVLSDLSRLFDPLGLVNPVTVKAKVFMQELWLLKLNWDESAPMEYHTRWKNFQDDLRQLDDIRIPRFVRSKAEIIRTELHGFADASLRAYGACIYVRCIDATGSITVHLLSAKSKVAPTKPIRTLPCLELCGCELLSKLLAKVRRCINHNLDEVFLWTDSQIVLGWLSSHPSTWQTFVANRVSQIQEITEDATWRYVNTKSNPADIISRGASVAELKTSCWFTGPEFLFKSPEFWPQMSKSSDQLPERRKIKIVMTCTVQESFLDIVYKTSSFSKNRRIFAYVNRFISNLRQRINKQKIVVGSFTASELEAAFHKLIWAIQQVEFNEEIDSLKKGNMISPKSCLQSLNPFLDDNLKLLRVGGRLQNADIPYNAKCPILLPKDNPFVKSYIRYLHFKHFHAGTQTLVSIIRQQFWIINARDYSRKILKECLHCFRYRSKLLQQMMGNLPKRRVLPSRAFFISGVDFCGPIMTTHKIRGKGPYKSYIAVFVCFVSRGVHLEIVSDLSSEAFIAALKRFTSRRTLCRHLYCDNATNFVGARRQLSELRDAFLDQYTQKTIAQWCAEESIEFHHIPPRAPHFGGIWEAAVKATKSQLFRTLQNSLLTFEELNTVCCQIEATLNSRPITQLSSDPSDEQALTPAHFWNQAPINCFVEPDLSSIKTSYLNRWRHISEVQQHFWRRWSAEYISGLHHRYKWKSGSPNTIVGTLVLIHDDNLPPMKWLLGRIVQTITGSGNKVRVVDVKTKAGVLRRPVHKIAPLPIETED